MELIGSSRSQELLVPVRHCTSPTAARVASRLAFLAAPPDLLAVAGPGLRGFPLAFVTCSRSYELTTFVILTSPSERSHARWNLLSVVPPLLGFDCRPPADIPPTRPLPGAEAPFGSTLPSAARVPPSWFRTTSTVSSASKSRVCCTPQPAKGSPRFVHASSCTVRRRCACWDQSP